MDGCAALPETDVHDPLTDSDLSDTYATASRGVKAGNAAMI